MTVSVQDVAWLLGAVAVGGVAVALLLLWHMLRNQFARQEEWRWIGVFVQAAEQQLADQEGGAKLDWVMTQVRARFPKLDRYTARAMIEACVGTLGRR